MSTALRLNTTEQSLEIDAALPFEATLNYESGVSKNLVASMQGNSGSLVPEIKEKTTDLPTLSGKALFTPSKELVEFSQ